MTKYFFVPELKVRLTLLDIRKLKPFAEEILQYLPEERYQKAMSYRREEDRLRSIGSSFLIMQTIGNQKLQYGEYGKPFVIGKNFNVSHSGNYVVLAESQNPVGVDIEEIVSEYQSEIAEVSLTQREKIWAGESPLRFFILWTRKESLLKCAGTGFFIEPNQIDVLSDSVFFMEKFYKFSSVIFDNYVISISNMIKKINIPRCAIT
ncbi:MAG: 4'-phosphopantetheinyl transferase superfamily protein [Selenomonadaceae bacterium]|nr:4'-phosphopantetheinyl transferase superfamily protein [Selenomonadaceae bacterium]